MDAKIYTFSCAPNATQSDHGVRRMQRVVAYGPEQALAWAQREQWVCDDFRLESVEPYVEPAQFSSRPAKPA